MSINNVLGNMSINGVPENMSNNGLTCINAIYILTSQKEKKRYLHSNFPERQKKTTKKL
jgi:hypothetical protein